MNTVFFLGAGFSRHFGHPTMNEFMNVAQDHLSPDDKRFLLELILEARQANALLESSPTNLEDVLSFAVMGDRLNLNEDDQPRATRLRRVLQRVYSMPFGNPNADSFWSRYDDALRVFGWSRMAEEETLSIITTNYDVNVECALLHGELWAELPFEYRVLPYEGKRVTRQLSGQATGGPEFRRPSSRSNDSVPVFKLHGSVDWFSGEKGDEVVVGNHVIKHRNGGPYVPVVNQEGYPAPSEPIIVPPSFLKPDLAGILGSVWQGAAKALNRAQEVIFVGYSFPPTDVEMKYFLARSLTGNGDLRRITIMDIRADEIVERLRRPDSGFGSHFKSFLHPIQGEWAKSSPPRMSRYA